MKLYKKQIKVFKLELGDQGFNDRKFPLTGWLDENEGIAAYNETVKRAAEEDWSYEKPYMEERFVPVQLHKDYYNNGEVMKVEWEDDDHIRIWQHSDWKVM